MQGLCPIIKKQFELSFDMLKKTIEYCPDCEPFAGKKDLTFYYGFTEKTVDSFFSFFNDSNIFDKSLSMGEITNLDAVLMQIRHIQYHVGHCNSIFRENHSKPVEWLDVV